jgi:hypothetical protein
MEFEPSLRSATLAVVPRLRALRVRVAAMPRAPTNLCKKRRGMPAPTSPRGR